jgi:uncharacterized protein (TIGR03067 family)
MKLLLTCASVLLSAALVVADDPTSSGKAGKGDKASCLDGTWKVLCAEKNGEPVPDAKDMTVTVKDNTITCNCSKTGNTMKIEFTGPGKARVTATEGKSDRQVAKGDGKGEAKEAVCVLTTDYLAVCIHDDKTEGKSQDGVYQPTLKKQCTVVLKRTDAK